MDFTEDKLDQAELRKRAALLDLTNDAIFVTELDGIITYWNQGPERLYGWTSAEAKGRDEAHLLRAEFPLAQNDSKYIAFDESGFLQVAVSEAPL